MVCLSETWAPDGNYTLDGGHRLFCCRDEFKFSGVAILVNARWAPCIIEFCKVSDRIAYVDLVLNGTKYRIVSVYIPHAGYDVNFFNMCFDHLRTTLSDGQQNGYRCMIGGDFNIVRHRGWRGDKLEELLCAFGLQVCAYPSVLPFDALWTFRSCLGAKRILDHNIVTLGTQVLSCKAIDDLRLRSDHRAVQACIELPSGERRRRRKKRKVRIDWVEYAKNVLSFSSGSVQNLSQLEEEVWNVASACEKSGKKDVVRPWETDELRELRVQRRIALDPSDRKRLPKQIWRLARN